VSSAWADVISKLLPFAGDLFQKRRMRRQCYRELSDNYQKLVTRIALCQSVSGLAAGAPQRFADGLDLTFNVWDFYNEDRNRPLLHKLNEAGAISSIYEKFSMIGNESSPGYAVTRGKQAAAEVDDAILTQSLDQDLYKDVSTPNAWRYMQDLIDGKRQSWRSVVSPL
jgi:hypothetical protein